ncbi:MAG: MarR family transcriptional regulator, partial [Bacteroidota bacterium]
VIRTLNVHYLAEMGYHGFKVGHIMVMMQIKAEGIKASEIVKKVNVSKQAISKLVHELENKGLLTIIQHPQDQRATLLQLTQEGQAFLEALNLCRNKVEQELFQVIGEQKLGEIKSILEELLIHYEENPLQDADRESFVNSKL